MKTQSQMLLEYLSKKTGKTIKEIEREMEASRRCEYCGSHGHKASKCPNKSR